MNTMNAGIDRENCWLVYATFAGDVTKTAHALQLPPAAIQKMVDDEQWATKLAPVILLAKGQKPGDLERAINRCVSFVNAHKMRTLLSRVLKSLSDLTEEELQSQIVTSKTEKDGSTKTTVSTRFLCDLASAFEKASAMAASALSDTAQDRSRRADSEGAGASVGEMHLAIAKAMGAVATSTTPRSLLLDAQLIQANELVESAAKAKSPYDEH